METVTMSKNDVFRFNKVIDRMRYGLIRISPSLVLIDKNRVAEALVDLPKRGAGVRKLFVNAADIEALKNEKGAAVTCRIYGKDKVVGVVAIREKSGNIILFLHPLLAAICSNEENVKVRKILRYYGKYILDIIYEASEGEGIYTVKSTGIPDKGYFINFGEDKEVRLSEALKAMGGKLAATDFKNNITVLIENNTSCVFKCVNFNKFMYVVTEQLAMLNSIGLGVSSKVYIHADMNFLYVTVEDSMKEAATKADEYFARIFTETIHLLKVHTDIRFKRDRFESTVAIPITEVSYKLRDIIVTFEGEYFGYYDYCLGFWDMGVLTE